MEIELKDQSLELIETDRAAESGFPVSIIKSCRKKFVFLRSATDERTLREWKSLHYEKLSGDKEGQRSIRLNDQWRLVFEIDTNCNPNKITVICIEDYHK
ncbi:type II toxin-antitoxin system RelE/ParE family toxin [Nitrosomonas sp.]|uniref:type II toxin-antitoxin system RelE/ParE family toxin n=1 Tax=Nitrosomonas sp. TaxID=42353 RepID=UPI00374CE7B2